MSTLETLAAVTLTQVQPVSKANIVTEEVLIAEPLSGIEVYNIQIHKGVDERRELTGRYIIRNKVDPLDPVLIEFHKGPLIDGNAAGPFNESLLHVLHHRLVELQFQLPCQENVDALNGIEQAIAALNKRTSRLQEEFLNSHEDTPKPDLASNQPEAITAPQ